MNRCKSTRNILVLDLQILAVAAAGTISSVSRPDGTTVKSTCFPSRSWNLNSNSIKILRRKKAGR